MFQDIPVRGAPGNESEVDIEFSLSLVSTGSFQFQSMLIMYSLYLLKYLNVLLDEPGCCDVNFGSLNPTFFFQDNLVSFELLDDNFLEGIEFGTIVISPRPQGVTGLLPFPSTQIVIMDNERELILVLEHLLELTEVCTL